MSADTDWLKECEENEPPMKKACSRKGKEKRTFQGDVDDKLDIVIKKLDTIERKVSMPSTECLPVVDK